MKNILMQYNCPNIQSLLSKADFCIEQVMNAKHGLTIEASKHVDQFMADLKKVIG